jgi:acylphosphatase
MSDGLARLHANIYGRVQGVNFRSYTQREAAALDITGWVANRADGSVEIVAEGDRAALQKLVCFLHQGPPAARVERIQAGWDEATGEFERFRIRYLR